MRDAGSANGAKDGRRRRSWSDDEKRRIVAESVEAGASIAEVARRYDLNANLLFTWRRRLGVKSGGGGELTPMLPVMISTEAAPATTSSGPSGRMEIFLAEGERIVVGADVDATALTRVLKALARR
jgi:transposase